MGARARLSTSVPGQEEQEDGEEKGHAEDNEGRRIQQVRHHAYGVAAVLRLQDGVRIKQAAVDLPSKPCASVGGGEGLSAVRRLEGIVAAAWSSGVRSLFSNHKLLSYSVSHPPPIQMHHRSSDRKDEARKVQPV